MCIAPVRSGSYGRWSRHRVSGNEAHVAVWGGRPARWSVSFGNDCGGCRRWWAGAVVRPPSTQVSSVVRASGHRPSILQVHLSSAITSVRPCLLRTRERWAGGVGGGGAEPTLPSRGRTSLEIVYAAWHVMCTVSEAMWCMYAIRYIERSARTRNGRWH